MLMMKYILKLYCSTYVNDGYIRKLYCSTYVNDGHIFKLYCSTYVNNGYILKLYCSTYVAIEIDVCRQTILMNVMLYIYNLGVIQYLLVTNILSAISRKLNMLLIPYAWEIWYYRP